MADTSETPTTFAEIAASMIVPKATAPVVPDGSNADPTGTSPDQDDLDGVSVAQDTSDQDGIPLNEDEDDSSSLTPNTLEGEDEEGSNETEAKPAPEDEDDVLSNLFEETQEERASNDPDTDAIDTSKLGDDLMISVTVDGEDVQVPLGELKKRHAGEGAIDKRLQTATEIRDTAASDYEQTRQLTTTMLTDFGQALFRRTVPQPDNNLLASNPTAYMQQKELYEQETAALTQSHNHLSTMMKTLDDDNTKATNDRRKAAGVELRRIMPVFNDPVKGPKVRTALMGAAVELGFTEAEVNAIENPLMFKALAYAARELARQKTTKAKKVVGKTRTLATTGTNRKPVTATQRNQKAVHDRAVKTGTIDDVAASMIETPARKRGRR